MWRRLILTERDQVLLDQALGAAELQARADADQILDPRAKAARRAKARDFADLRRKAQAADYDGDDRTDRQDAALAWVTERIRSEGAAE